VTEHKFSQYKKIRDAESTEDQNVMVIYERVCINCLLKQSLHLFKAEDSFNWNGAKREWLPDRLCIDLTSEDLDYWGNF